MVSRSQEKCMKRVVLQTKNSNILKLSNESSRTTMSPPRLSTSFPNAFAMGSYRSLQQRTRRGNVLSHRELLFLDVMTWTAFKRTISRWWRGVRGPDQRRSQCVLYWEPKSNLKSNTFWNVETFTFGGDLWTETKYRYYLVLFMRLCGHLKIGRILMNSFANSMRGFQAMCGLLRLLAWTFQKRYQRQQTEGCINVLINSLQQLRGR